LQEQIAEGGFAGSDSPCYPENRHTKQMAEPSAGSDPPQTTMLLREDLRRAPFQLAL
jgi:hypothetical protein